MKKRDAWACPVAVSPLHGTLALRLLDNLKSEGWRLEYVDGGEFPTESYKAGFAAG